MTKSKKTALMTAVDILARSETSEARLVDKLKRKDFDAGEIEKAVAKLKEMGYLNDKAAAKRQFEFLYNESKSSVREIILKLMRRGFAREDIEEAVPENKDGREETAALKALKLKYKRDADITKMKAYLYRHGFSFTVCSSAVTRFVEEG